MFDGGGVLIDHYIIQVDNGTQLETPGPTYSFDIMYNTTLSVNISAHNCAGYSDPFPLEMEYVCKSTQETSYDCTTSVAPSNTMTATASFIRDPKSTRISSFPAILQSPTNKQTPERSYFGNLLLLVVPVTTVTTILISVLAVFALLYTYKCLAKSRHCNIAGKNKKL